MKELILLIISAAIVNNVVLSQFLGLCPFLGVSKKVETAGGMGAAVIFVITIASLVTSLIYKFILAPMIEAILSATGCPPTGHAPTGASPAAIALASASQPSNSQPPQ